MNAYMIYLGGDQKQIQQKLFCDRLIFTFWETLTWHFLHISL